MGRCLDKIYEYGPTRLVSDVTFQIASQQKLLGKTIHVDTTSLTLYGNYDADYAQDPDAPKVTYGYSKDKRADLKQLILNLAINNKADLPMFMASHNGNASDKKILIQATRQIEKCCANLANTPSFIYVADSAIYESCLKENAHILWLSRVPMQRKETKKLLENSTTYDFKAIPDTGYKMHSLKRTIAGVKQRWLLVYSEKAHEREKKTLARRVAKENIEADKELSRLGKQTYNCKADAKKALNAIQKKWKYHQVHTINLDPVQQYEAKGRPAKNAQKKTVGYHIKARIVEDTAKIHTILTRKSHFILATNQLNKGKLSDQEMLFEYKKQHKVEKGFAFIKDNTFEVSSVFLKKPSRISALMAIMVLSLFTYSLAQYLLRIALKEAGEFVPNQLEKPIQRPTAKWIFFLFRSIQVLYIKNDHAPPLELIVNLNPLLNRIITYFGKETMCIYGIALPKTD